MPKTWGIKLGKGGKFTSYCINRQPPIIGIGWKDCDTDVVASGDANKVWKHVGEIYREIYDEQSPHKIGQGAGQIFNFCSQAAVGDFVWHFSTALQKVFLMQIRSEVRRRDFDLDRGDIDIWHYREVKVRPIGPLSQLHGDLVASLRYPWQAFWSIDWATDYTASIWEGREEIRLTKEDQAIDTAFKQLIDLLRQRLRTLSDSDWEILTAEFVKAQGGRIKGEVGGTRPGIDVEADFVNGLLPSTTFRFQVKRYSGRAVDWPEIQSYYENYGEGSQFVFVSAFGFTEEARQQAEDNGVVLLDDQDMARFVLFAVLPEHLASKLRLELD